MFRQINDLVGRFLPPWFQIIVFAYLAVVLASWSIDKLRERRGVTLAAIAMALAAFLGLRAAFLLTQLL
jgi:hypothetical protein